MTDKLTLMFSRPDLPLSDQSTDFARALRNASIKEKPYDKCSNVLSPLGQQMKRSRYEQQRRRKGARR